MIYEIPSWLEYQHYGDKKTVPWVKLHFRILTSESWVMLDDSHKCLMITCMLHASENNGLVTKGIEYLKAVGRISGDISFKPLIECGFLSVKECLENSRIIQNESTSSLSLSSSESLSESKIKIVNENVSREASEEFLEFWDQFPKQRAGSKQKAWSAWQYALKQNKALPAEIIAGCLAYAASEEVAGGYAKGCAAWLNDERWGNNYSIKTHKNGQKDGYFDGIMKATVMGIVSQ